MTLPATPSLDAARAELVARISAAAAAWTTYTLIVEDENRQMIDLASADAQNAILCWDIVWRGGRQASLGPAPLGRQQGQLMIAAKIKEGCGTAGCLKLLDHVIPYLELRDMAITRTAVAEVQEGRPLAGWYGVPAIINFWIDRVVTPVA